MDKFRKKLLLWTKITQRFFIYIIEALLESLNG